MTESKKKRRIPNYLRKKPLRIKIILLNMILLFLLLCINYMHFYYAIYYIKRSVKNNFEVVNFQIIQNINSYIDSFENISLMMMHSDRFQEILREDYRRAQYPQYEMLQDQNWIKNELLSFYSLHDEVLESIVVYVKRSGLIVVKGHNVELNPDYTPYHESWYQQIIDAAGGPVVIDKHAEQQASPEMIEVVSLGRLIRNMQGDQLGVILINIASDDIAQLIPSKAIMPGSLLMILDGNDNILYSNRSEYSGDHEIYLEQDLPKTGWRLIHSVPGEVLYHDVNNIRRFVLLMVGFLTVIIIIVSVRIAHSITRPLEELDRAMHKLRNGDFSANLMVDSGDEIGYLGESFNTMVAQVNRLMREAVEVERQKRKAELKFLQNQINPHFIYNTLNMIKRMAQFQGAGNISDALDNFIDVLRRITRKGTELGTVKSEIDFLDSYLKLLELRYMNGFEYSLDLDPAVGEVYIPQLLLQPFVENAVYHGFQGERGDYLLELRCESTEDGLAITIRDNGEGFYSDPNEDSIGISNVQKRLELYYGDSARLDISSDERGTLVVLELPDEL